MTFTKRLKLTSTLILVTTLSACSNATTADAQPSETVQASVKTAEQGNWDIIAADSSLQFSASQEGEAFTGRFKVFSGIINFDPEALDQTHIRIEIPLKSVDAGSKDRNSTLPGKVWFSTKAHPIAIYETDEVVAVGDGYEAKGTLTLKGKTIPVPLFFNLDIQGDLATMTGQATLDRTAWDVGASPWDTNEFVSKAVEIEVKVAANRH